MTYPIDDSSAQFVGDVANYVGVDYVYSVDCYENGTEKRNRYVLCIKRSAKKVGYEKQFGD